MSYLEGGKKLFTPFIVAMLLSSSEPSKLKSVFDWNSDATASSTLNMVGENVSPQIALYERDLYNSYYDLLYTQVLRNDEVGKRFLEIVDKLSIRKGDSKSKDLSESLRRVTGPLVDTEERKLSLLINKLSKDFGGRNGREVAEVMCMLLFAISPNVPKGNSQDSAKYFSQLSKEVIMDFLSDIENSIENTKSIDLMNYDWEVFMGLDGDVKQVKESIVHSFLDSVEETIGGNGKKMTRKVLRYEADLEKSEVTEVLGNIRETLASKDPKPRVVLFAGHGLENLIALNKKLAFDVKFVTDALDERFSNPEVVEALKGKPETYFFYSCYSADMIAKIIAHIDKKGYPVNLAFVAETELGKQLGLACMPFSKRGMAPYEWIKKNPRVWDLINSQGGNNLGSNPSIYIYGPGLTKDGKPRKVGEVFLEGTKNV